MTEMIGMPYEALVSLARKRKLVRWSPSNKVEQLRWSVNPATGQSLVFAGSYSLFHRRITEHVITYKSHYYCEVVQPNEFIKVGDFCRRRFR